jgi:23S rRNA (adenine2503-C2)-methyltransferase
MLQYTLIAGVNDSLEEAQDLVLIAKRLNAKVNIIPLNTVAVTRLKSPTQNQVQSFRDILHKEGIRVMVRYSKGQDIAAACGQLVVES